MTFRWKFASIENLIFFRRKAKKSREFWRKTFALLLHNTVRTGYSSETRQFFLRVTSICLLNCILVVHQCHCLYQHLRLHLESSIRVGHLILRALAIRASDPQNALARTSFHSPKSLPPPPHPRVFLTILVVVYFYYWMTIEIYFNTKWLWTSATVNTKLQFLFTAVLLPVSSTPSLASDHR